MADMPYTVALTGGIASGKSAVAERFAALGAGVVDADLVARELVEPGTPGLAAVVAAFGTGVLDADGRLARRALRERVFAGAQARATLEAILHPRVREVLRERSRNVPGPYALLVIPLLAEGAGYDWIDRVLVVDVPRELQLARLIARDELAPELAEAMLGAQASRAQRLALADDVIDNRAAPAELDAAVHALHEDYVRRAGSRGRAGGTAAPSDQRR
jgi:dephospho-CoA kinase